jgi:hypothetical protein
MTVLFAAVHESGCGTKRTNRSGLRMSVVRGGPEVTGTGQKGAIDPEETLGVRQQLNKSDSS